MEKSKGFKCSDLRGGEGGWRRGEKGVGLLYICLGFPEAAPDLPASIYCSLLSECQLV